MAKASGNTRIVSSNNAASKWFIENNLHQIQSVSDNITEYVSQNSRFEISARIEYSKYGHIASLHVALNEGSNNMRSVKLLDQEFKGEYGDGVVRNGKLISGAENLAINELQNKMNVLKNEANKYIKKWHKEDTEKYNRLTTQLKESYSKGWISKDVYGKGMDNYKRKYRW